MARLSLVILGILLGFCVFDAAVFPFFFHVPKFATHSLNHVISALPMNGGSYNVLINTTSKAIASIAACLGVISYIATGVVSATTVSILKKVLVGFFLVNFGCLLMWVHFLLYIRIPFTHLHFSSPE